MGGGAGPASSRIGSGVGAACRRLAVALGGAHALDQLPCRAAGPPVGLRRVISGKPGCAASKLTAACVSEGDVVTGSEFSGCRDPAFLPASVTLMWRILSSLSPL